MTTTPTSPDVDTSTPRPFEDFRAMLAATDDPAAYWQCLTELLSLYMGLLRHQHRRCTEPKCRTCGVLADAVDLARAHNSLQTFDELYEIDQPYPILRHITTDRTAGPTKATA